MLPADPAGIVIIDGDDPSAMSGVITCTVNVTLWLSCPLATVAVTVYAPLNVPCGTEIVITVDWLRS